MYKDNDQANTRLITDTSSASTELGPNLRTDLMKLILGYQVSEAIQVAVHLNLAGLLKGQAMTDEKLAAATGTKPVPLYRLLRVLEILDILNEITPHHFSLAPKGQLLQEDVPDSVYTSALFYGSQRPWQIWHNLLYSVQTGENATKHVFGMPTWEYYAQHPVEAPLFYNFMTESSQQIAPSLAANYNFEGIKVVADIGGAQGNMLAAILKANTHLKGILFDLPQITKGAEQHLKKEGVIGKCQIVGGDMFVPWPFKADLYLISRVIHDWHDEQAITILKNCRKAMEADSKVILVERILPEDKDAALLFYLSDLNMLVGPGGQERNLQQYQNLLQASGLCFTRTIPLNQTFSIIEAVIA